MDGMESVLNAVPQRLRAAGWAVALPLVMLVCIVYWGLRPWTVAAVLLAGVITLLAPAVAAGLAAIALIGFASCAFALCWRASTLPPGTGTGRLAPACSRLW
jgi:hypothetical protein